MQKVMVYKVKLYDIRSDEYILSRRMVTKEGAIRMGGAVIPETGIEIDADKLEPGEEWTKRDFIPDYY